MEREKNCKTIEVMKKEIEEKLNSITDPGSGAKLMDLGLIRNIVIDDGVVSMTFRPSSSVCPVAFTLAPKIKAIVENINGVKRVEMSVENFKRADELMDILQDN